MKPAEAVDGEREYREWRIVEARKLGLTQRQAERFAECDAAVHDLEALVKRGCPPRLALRILL